MVNGELSLAATGDSIWTRRVSVYDEERFLSLIKILKNADVAYTNLETTLHAYKGYPVSVTAGPTALIAEPYIAEEYKWAGFNLLSRANNHTLDWGIEGLLAGSEVLDKAGLVHAGVGANLGEARAPAFLETKRGRVALVSIDTTLSHLTAVGNFTPREAACASSPRLMGRPGVNPLRWETYYVVSPTDFEELKNIASRLFSSLKKGELDALMEQEPHWECWQRDNWWPKRPDPAKEFYFLQRRFVMGDKPGFRSTALESDVKGNLKSVEDARKQADWVLVSLHHHGWQNLDGSLFPEFIEKFARACIDAGADAFIGNGPHHLLGIEIYRDKPIFYSLGNFIFQTNGQKLPADAAEEVGLSIDSTPREYFDKWTYDRYPEAYGPFYLVSVVALCRFKDGKLTELKLYPIELGYGKPNPWLQSGRPMLANEEEGKKIVDLMRKLSTPYGAQIEFEDGIGVVKLK